MSSACSEIRPQCFKELRSCRFRIKMKCITCSVVVQKNLFSRTGLGLLEFPKFSIKSWSVVFFGSDNFSLVSLKALHRLKEKKALSNLEVVTSKGNPVHEYSLKNNIVTHSWLPDLNGIYDFGVIVSFGKLIPKSIIDKFPLGIINVHASLLPKYRGGMPIVHAIKNGETSTGITVTTIKADKFDVGEIILQKACSIDKNELMPSIYKRLSVLGCECLLEVISGIPECLQNCTPQIEQQASYAPKLTKEVSIIRWNDMTALEIFNLYRALFGTFELTSSWKGKKVRFTELGMTNADDLHSLNIKNDLGEEPGRFTFNTKTKLLYVQCKGTVITVMSFKFNNNRYSALSFYNGYLHNISRTFWKFES